MVDLCKPYEYIVGVDSLILTCFPNEYNAVCKLKNDFKNLAKICIESDFLMHDVTDHDSDFLSFATFCIIVVPDARARLSPVNYHRHLH